MASGGGEQVRVGSFIGYNWQFIFNYVFITFQSIYEDLTAASSASGDIKNSRKIIIVYNIGSNFTIA